VHYTICILGFCSVWTYCGRETFLPHPEVEPGHTTVLSVNVGHTECAEVEPGHSTVFSENVGHTEYAEFRRADCKV
jgi:hypothetical protein